MLHESYILAQRLIYESNTTRHEHADTKRPNYAQAMNDMRTENIFRNYKSTAQKIFITSPALSHMIIKTCKVLLKT